MHAVGTLGTEPAARLFTVQSGAQHADGVSSIAALRSCSKMAQRLLAQSMWSSLLLPSTQITKRRQTALWAGTIATDCCCAADPGEISGQLIARRIHRAPLDSQVWLERELRPQSSAASFYCHLVSQVGKQGLLLTEHGTAPFQTYNVAAHARQNVLITSSSVTACTCSTDETCSHSF